jgi:hypothetical protein
LFELTIGGNHINAFLDLEVLNSRFLDGRTSSIDDVMLHFEIVGMTRSLRDPVLIPILSDILIALK